MKKAVVCILESRARAEAVVQHLHAGGFATSDISVLFPDKTGARDVAHEKSTKAPEGATAGALAGGALGGTLGLLAGIGALAIPGLGPFIAAGPLMAALGGAALGGATGGVAGALVGMGIPELEAKAYQGKLVGDNVLVAVHTDDAKERERALETFKRFGVKDVSTVNETSVQPTRSS